MWRKRYAAEVAEGASALRGLGEEVTSLRDEFAASSAGMDAVTGAVGEGRDRVLERIAGESEVAREERRLAREWREATDARLAEMTEAGEALRVWIEQRVAAPRADDGAGVTGAGATDAGATDAGATGAGAMGAGADDCGESDERCGEHVVRSGHGAYGCGGVGENNVTGNGGNNVAENENGEGNVTEGNVTEGAREEAEKLVLGRGTRLYAASAPPRDGGGRAEQGSGTTEFGDDPEVAHAALLLTAATISSVRMVCHRDLWAFVAAEASGQAHFRSPSVTEDPESGRVTATLSGPSLIAVLVALRGTWQARNGAMDADWAQAVTAYARIRAGLVDVRPGNGRSTVEIRLDDGVEPVVAPAHDTNGAEGTDGTAAA